MNYGTQKCRIGVLVSGSGTNLQAIIDKISDGYLNAEIACVISNKADAYALTRAAKHGIPCIVHDNKGFTDRLSYDAHTVTILKEYTVDLVVLAGFMRILSKVMVNAYPNAIMNIHPALLPAFPGLHAQKQALEYGVKVSGCTIHFVDDGMDTGPIIMQSTVQVDACDNEDSLSGKIQKAEHQSYPAAIKLYVDNKLEVNGRTVKILD